MRARRMGMTGTALALCLWARAADAVTWVRYDFSGAGTATYSAPAAPYGVVQPVVFSGVAFVDLDAHAIDRGIGQPWYSDGARLFRNEASPTGAPLAASAAAGAAGTVFSLSEAGIGGGFQAFSAAAMVAGADGRFPVFTGTQAASGAASFRLGNNRYSWNGTGRVSALSMARVDAPGAWSFSISPGPIPEPATWVTLLAGFALLGAGLRYRRLPAGVTFG